MITAQEFKIAVTHVSYYSPKHYKLAGKIRIMISTTQQQRLTILCILNNIMMNNEERREDLSLGTSFFSKLYSTFTLLRNQKSSVVPMYQAHESVQIRNCREDWT